ncbi:MAG: lipoyl domain-containing protein [Clostridia bacterium]|nr:lipoyl domain-containing protein [Clostridia bacterium]
MGTELRMPRLRPEMKKGMLAAWLKEEGESFEKGEALFEIETDKVVNQIEAERAGRIKKLLVDEGDEVEPGAVIALIEE